MGKTPRLAFNYECSFTNREPFARLKNKRRMEQAGSRSNQRPRPSRRDNPLVHVEANAVPVELLLCPKPCLSQTVPERAQNGTQPDCPEPCPEVLSIIVIGDNQARFGTRPSRVPNCAQSPGTVWDTHRVSQTMPRHGLGQGTVWDTHRVSQTMQARFGTKHGLGRNKNSVPGATSSLIL
ncbi:hypothetical protein Bbelb_214780 [Branchiostoma belcheri]|nr:hypothetical protein Bbelb_214780 [Branchiostoma belcheri]